MTTPNFNWDAPAFFSRLTAANKLAASHSFRFTTVSSLEGFYEALETRQPLIAVDDTSQGELSLANTGHLQRVKTIFLAMPHAIDSPQSRQQCMDTMREIFRQFLSILILEKTLLEQHHLYLDDRIIFEEMDQYFFSGMACAYFRITATTYTHLTYNPDEWLRSPTAP